MPDFQQVKMEFGVRRTWPLQFADSADWVSAKLLKMS
jgi:hypothetical protein